MNVRQMSETDWIKLMQSGDKCQGQVNLILERQARGMPLATWEQYCLRAYYRQQQQAA